MSLNLWHPCRLCMQITPMLRGQRQREGPESSLASQPSSVEELLQCEDSHTPAQVFKMESLEKEACSGLCLHAWAHACTLNACTTYTQGHHVVSLSWAGKWTEQWDIRPPNFPKANFIYGSLLKFTAQLFSCDVFVIAGHKLLCPTVC